VKHIIGLLGVSFLLLFGILPITAGDNDLCFDWTYYLPEGNAFGVGGYVGFTYADPVTLTPWPEAGYLTVTYYVDNQPPNVYNYTLTGQSPGIGQTPFGAVGRVRITMRFTPPDDRDIYFLYSMVNQDSPYILFAIEKQKQRCDEMGNGSGDPDIVYPPDDRINWQHGDDVAVIYRVNESEKNPAYHVYQPDSDNLNRPLVINAADFPNPMPPAEDTWIDGEGLVNVYILATGEIQFNIGPTPDGKVRVTIYPDLTGEGVYGYEYNIFDQTSTGDISNTVPLVSDTGEQSAPAQTFMCNYLGLQNAGC
jgi:hypothetical protein